MKIQNLAIIFIIIIIPLLMILGFYLKLQEDTLEKQAMYTEKLSSATKEGIRAYEINTVNWRETRGETRRNVTASMNTFLTSLANNLGIAGTAKEYMANYVPAVAMTLYNGYYIYSPMYVPKTIENHKGVQLYYDGHEITTNASVGGKLNDVLYEPEVGGTTLQYTYIDDNGAERKTTITFTTNAAQAKKVYKHSLSNEIPYSGNYVNTSANTDVTINYSLDNRIYVYGKINGKNIDKQGCLVYFNNDCTLPKISIKANAEEEEDIQVINKISDMKYFGSNISPEILTEQILYLDNSGKTEVLDTYRYVYDITGTKLYFDTVENNFFTISSKKEKLWLKDTKDVKAGSPECRYKSVSVLTGDGSSFKKIYQALNGRDKGKWFINLKEQEVGAATETSSDVSEIIDTEIDETADKYGFSSMYRDYSAINYYVEAYAFTKMISRDLGGSLTYNRVYFDETSKKYTKNPEDVSGIFNITENNDMEKIGSPIWEHKRQLMIDSINSNLNLSISNYAQNTSKTYKLPVLTSQDWDQIFNNISIISFFQGIPIGLKIYNNYAIATSAYNRDYVDPDGLYFSNKGTSYHRPYCAKVQNIDEIETEYKGYRSVEYTIRSYEKDNNITYYYQHTKQGVGQELDKSSDLACYSCIINKANYDKTINTTPASANEKQIMNIQIKAYKEALARERYYQHEVLAAKLGIMVRYHENRKISGNMIGIVGMPDDQEVEIGQPFAIAPNKPKIDTTDKWQLWKFIGWSKTPDGPVEYQPGDTATFFEDTDLYAKWTLSMSSLNWQRDYTETISNIRFPEPPENSQGSIVDMVGNRTLPGKGAAWVTLDTTTLKIKKFSFDYDVQRGDSFNAAGMMFNVIDTPNQLTGYLFSINFEGQFLQKANGKNGAIYKFQYTKNENNKNFDTLDLVESFQLSTTGGSAKGHMDIEVTSTGYEISGTQLTQVYKINVPNLQANTFGFFSDHYSHNCSRIGAFKLTNVVVEVEEINP